MLKEFICHGYIYIAQIGDNFHNFHNPANHDCGILS